LLNNTYISVSLLVFYFKNLVGKAMPHEGQKTDTCDMTQVLAGTFGMGEIRRIENVLKYMHSIGSTILSSELGKFDADVACQRDRFL
jgi:hypothetical protein